MRHMTISEAINLLTALYNKALTLPHIKNPVAWALYHAWEEADARGKKEVQDDKA